MILGSLLHVGCTKDNYIDTGISNGRYHGNLMQYMASNSYDWDSTILLVRHAGEEMVRLFEGKDPAHKEITFFRYHESFDSSAFVGIRSQTVSDLDPEWCRECC